MKKFAALLLALTMVLGMATITASAEGSERVITIGTTYDVYWDSFDGSIDANPYYTGTVADEMMFAKVKQIEDKWNVKFEYINLTYAGAKESINTSVLAGTPDVDVYMMDLPLAEPPLTLAMRSFSRPPAPPLTSTPTLRCAAASSRRSSTSSSDRTGKHAPPASALFERLPGQALSRGDHAAGVQPADD